MGGHGFILARNGTFTSFDAPGSSTLTVATSINPPGDTTGYYFDASGSTHGFLRASNGTWTTIDVPGAS
jgi:hypothetical protein